MIIELQNRRLPLILLYFSWQTFKAFEIMNFTISMCSNWAIMEPKLRRIQVSHSDTMLLVNYDYDFSFENLQFVISV